MKLLQKIKCFFNPEIKKLRKYLNPETESINKVFIYKSSILKNIELIKYFQPNSSFFPVLKSNAYWHWILQILEILKWKDFPYIAVDSYPEYQIVLQNSKFNILLIWETLPENYKNFDFNRTTFVVYNILTLKKLIELKKKIKIHLFLNTWMNREGLKKEKLENFLEILKNQKNVELEWVMSHFHSADKIDFSDSISQIISFKKMYKIIEEKWFSPKWRHIWASAGILRIKDDFFNAFRPGLILYWYNPLQFNIKGKTNILRPALNLQSKVISVQEIKAWEIVWYLWEWKAENDCIICTIPFWYYEWLSIDFSWKMLFRCANWYFSQVWRISMNLCSFLWNNKTKIWSFVRIIDWDTRQPNTIYQISKKSWKSVYEILAKINKDIRREII